MTRARDEVQARFIRATTDNGPDLLRYFQRRVDHDADLVAETLLVAWRRRQDLPHPPRDARLWLYGVARNVLNNARRTERRRHALADALRTHTETETTPDSSEALALRSLIDDLDPQLAEVVTLAHWDGLSFEEIARLQDVPSATIRGRYRKARLQLRSALIEAGG